MALIDELKEKQKRMEGSIDEMHAKIRKIGSILEVAEAYRNDIDRAIAALTAQDAPDLTAAVAERTEGAHEPTEAFWRILGRKEDAAVEAAVAEPETALKEFERDPEERPFQVYYKREDLAGVTGFCTITDARAFADAELAAGALLIQVFEGKDLLLEASSQPVTVEPVTSSGEGEESLDQFETTESDPEQNDYDSTGIMTADDLQGIAVPNPHYPSDDGYAPVVAADDPEPQPESLLDRFNPFRVKADA